MRVELNEYVLALPLRAHLCVTANMSSEACLKPICYAECGFARSDPTRPCRKL